MGNLLGSPFRKYVNNQIKKRQEISGKTKDRSLEEISYLNSRNAWVKLASSVYIEKRRLDFLNGHSPTGNDLLNGVIPGYDLAIKNVLQGGLVSKGNIDSNSLDTNGLLTDLKDGIEDIYSARVDAATKFRTGYKEGIKGINPNPAYGSGGTNFGFSPMPGITSVELRDLNRGSIKKASINLKVHNVSQFDIIDVLYLRLGYTVCLEWGYNKYISSETGDLEMMGNTLIDKEFWLESNTPYPDFLDKIEEKRKQYEGNYDGIIGVISNFSWEFQDDGTYDVKIEIISLGDVIESLKVNLPPQTADFTKRKYAADALEAAKGDLANEQATYTQFYNVLYPGLEEELERIYNILKSKANSDTGVFNWDFDTFSGGLGQPAYFATLKDKINPPTIDFSQIGDQLEGVFKKRLQEKINSEIVDWGSVFTSTFDGVDSTVFGGINNNSWIFYDSSLSENLNSFNRELGTYSLDPETGVTILLGKVAGSGQWEVRQYITDGDVLLIDNKKRPIYDNSISTPDLDKTYDQYLFINYNTSFTWSFGGLNNATIGSVDAFVWSYYDSTKVLDTPKEKLWYNLTDIDKDRCTFAYYTAEHFKVLFYNFCKDTIDLLIGGDDDPEFATPDEDTPQEEIDAIDFQRRIERNKDKNKIFKWFYNVRNMWSDFTYNSFFQITEDEYVLAQLEDTPLKYNQYFQAYFLFQKYGLDKDWDGSTMGAYEAQETYKKKFENSKVNIKLYGKKFNRLGTLENGKPVDKIGIVLNPTNLNQGINEEWKKQVKYPTYTQDNEGTVDFVKLETNPIQSSYYVRLGCLLDFIEDQIIITKQVSGGKYSPILSIDTDEKTNICYVIDNVISNDPQKCIINNNSYFTGMDGDGNVNFEQIFEGLNNYQSNITSPADYSWGNIMNIYMNMDRIEEIFDKTDKNNQITLFDALKSICDDINQSLGNINNIEPVINKEKNSVTFIDQTPIPGLDFIRTELGGEYINQTAQKEAQVPLEVFGYNTKNNTSTFVRNIGMSTEISKEYATAITIGATSQGEIPGMESCAFSRWNDGLIDRFKPELGPGGGSDNAPSSNSQTSNTDKLDKQNQAVVESYKIQIDSGYVKLGYNRTGPDLSINGEYISTNNSTSGNFYIYEQAKNTIESYNPDLGEGIVESSIGFLPINLKVDMDGIGGIRIYDLVKVNTSFLPSNYPDTLEFICTGVNHKLENNEWVTSLKTLATNISKT